MLNALPLKTLLVIDPGVLDVATLLEGCLAHVDVMVLTPDGDALGQIGAYLLGTSGKSAVSSLHILSHGMPGALRLAGETFDLPALARQSAALARIAAALAPDADVVLYGCSVAASASGRRFIAFLEGALDAPVAASSSPVGASERGGAWSFVARDGQPHPTAFHPAAMVAYQGLLTSYNLTLGIDTPVLSTVDDTLSAFSVGSWQASDILDGKGGTDTLELFSNQTITLNATSLLNFERIVIYFGNQDITFHDSAVLAGQSFVIDASISSGVLRFNGSLELDGKFAITGSPGQDSLIGGQGNDTISGGLGADTIRGGEGNNVINGGDGNDSLYTLAGADQIFGGIGNDSVSAGAGNDTVFGGDDNDTLYGDAGNDNLYGEAGTDFLYGGAGIDVMAGGAGNDKFSGTAAELAGDTISDFTVGDTIEVSGAALGALNGAPVSSSIDLGSGQILYLTGATAAMGFFQTATVGGFVIISINSNLPPVITSNGGGATATVSVAENQTSATTLTATDNNGDTVTYALTGGADQARFSINPATGVLTFVASPNFEAPTDSDANNTYIVDVRASDGNGGIDTQIITVTVTNVNEVITITSNGAGATAVVNVVENNSAVTTVTATDPDGDTPVFSIVGGADMAKFSINSSTGVLQFIASPNFESPGDADANNSYVVDVSASDGLGSTDVQTITVFVANINEAPVISSNGGGATAALSAAENQLAVTTVTATDNDGDTVSYAITGGADQAKFAINTATGVLTFVTPPNFEAAADSDANNTYLVNVTASDSYGGTNVQAITVTVTNVNEAITITSNGAGATAAVSVAENQIAVTTVTASDLDGDTPSFAIIGGTDQAKFTINATTGVLSFVAPQNFEAPTDADANNTYLVNVTASDGKGSTASQAITVTVTNVNEGLSIASNGGGPTAAANAAENQGSVTTVTALDLDGDTPSFAITGGADQAKFAINAATGVLTFIANPNFEAPTDSDGNNTYLINVTASDGKGSKASQAITVTVTNVNEGLSITSNGGGATAAVNAAENQGTVTTVTASDIDGDTPTFAISGGVDQAKFAINAATGVLTFVANPNFEAPTDSDGNNTYLVTVTASDGKGSTAVQAITVTVTNVNEAVSITSNGAGATASVGAAENQVGVTTVTASDIDGDTPTFAISGGVDQAKFAINAATGVLTFFANPNFEAPADSDSNNTYLVNVTASDGKGSTAVQAITVTVTNVNEAVSITSNGAGATASVGAAENQVGVTTVTASDIDGDTPTFAITSGTDASKFTIDSVTGVLTFVAAPDFEAPADADANNTYLVTVTASDGKGSTAVQAITVAVTNVNEGLSITSNGGGATAAVNAAENQGSVTTVTALDVDGDTPTFAISGGVDQAKFGINATTGVLTFIANPDFEAPADSDGNNTYLVTVTASDGKGSATSQAITVTVTDVNEAVSITSNGAGATASVGTAENQPGVTTVTASDIDGDTPSFSITGGADQAKFAINAVTGVLTFIANPNFEAPTDSDGNNTYLVNVTAGDGKGNTAVQAITVTVTNVNEAVSITSNGAGATAAVGAAENQVGITTVAASDIDGDTPTFSITGGADQAKFAINAATGMLTFIASPNFEAPTDSDGNNTYLVNVTASDGKGSTASQAITVTVTNVNEAPLITSNGAGAAAAVSVAENQVAVTTVTAADPDGGALVFSISGGSDQAKFVINGATGALSFVAAPNFGIPSDTGANNTYVVDVTVVDGNGSTDVQTITATVINVNDNPVITSNGGGTTAAIELFENETGVTTVTGTDADGTPPTFSITGGADQAKFSINPVTGVLTFIAAPDFDAPTDNGGDNTYVVAVTAGDGAGGVAEQTITVSILDIDASPQLQPQSPPAALSTGGDGIAPADSDDTVLVYIANSLNVDDVIDGGGGFDSLQISAQQNVVLGPSTLINFEALIITAGIQNITSSDATVGAGKILLVDASASTAALTWDGGAETDGAFRLLGGSASDTLIGGAGADIISAFNGDDVIAGNAGNDIISGGLGNDIVSAGPGNDKVDGGGGKDILVLAGAGRADYTMRLDQGQLLLTQRAAGTDGTDLVANIETLRFAGGGGVSADLDFNLSDVAALVRLYDVLLNRRPDEAGINFWISASEGGYKMHQIAQWFAASSELQANFGLLSDDAFVGLLFQNGLHRAASTGEVSQWTQLLANGSVDRGDVLLAMANSAEVIELIGPITTSIPTL